MVQLGLCFVVVFVATCHKTTASYLHPFFITNCYISVAKNAASVLFRSNGESFTLTNRKFNRPALLLIEPACPATQSTAFLPRLPRVFLLALAGLQQQKTPFRQRKAPCGRK